MGLFSAFCAFIGSFFVGAVIVVCATVAIGFAVAFVACQVMEIFKLRNDSISSNSGLLGALAGFIWSLCSVLKVSISFAFFGSIGLLLIVLLIGGLLLLVAESRRPPLDPEYM